MRRRHRSRCLLPNTGRASGSSGPVSLDEPRQRPAAEQPYGSRREHLEVLLQELEARLGLWAAGLSEGRHIPRIGHVLHMGIGRRLPRVPSAVSSGRTADTMVTTERGSAPDGAPERASMAPTSPPVAHPTMYRAVRAMSGMWRPLAGHRAFPLWAVLRHRGRRSGRDYAVPVGVRATTDAYFIALRSVRYPVGPQRPRRRRLHGPLAWRGPRHDRPDARRGRRGGPAFPPVLRWMMRARARSRHPAPHEQADRGTASGRVVARWPR